MIDKKTNLLSVSGKKRSGKNTVATLVNKILSKSKNGVYEEKAFAYLVKKFASELTGEPLDSWETDADKSKELGPEWDTFNDHGLKIPMTKRHFLKLLGSDACNQHLHKNVWVNGLFKDWDENKMWIVTDVRFPQEVEAIKKRGGIVIRVSRPESDKSGDTHISEVALDNFNGFDFNIVNNGTLDELEEKVRAVLFKLKLI
jgi:hypothetical protein